MRRFSFIFLLTWALSGVSHGQTGPFYSISNLAGANPLGDGGPAASALLLSPSGVAFDGAGNLYIGDSLNHLVRKVSPSGTITTVAGIGLFGYNGDARTATSARLAEPRGVAVDGAGNLYIADRSNSRIRKVTPAGVITTVAGTGGFGFSGENVPATTAQLFLPIGVTVDNSGNLYIADSSNHRIRKVTAAGIITTVAGTGRAGFSGDNATATQTDLNFPNDVKVDQAGNLYIADNNNNRVRKVSPGGIITTVAGNGTAALGADGGPATLSALFLPRTIALDSSGNLYIADNNTRIRKVNSAGVISTMAGSTSGVFGFGGDGALASAALFASPASFDFDKAGNLYLADSGNDRIRVISQDLMVSTFAGATHFGGDNGPATAALLRTPRSVAADNAGNVYVADSNNNRIRRVSASGTITTIMGADTPGFSGNNGPATAAQLNSPSGVAVDGAGNLFIVDRFNERIRKVAANNGVTTVIAGTGIFGTAGDGGLAQFAQLGLTLSAFTGGESTPAGVAVDSSGNVYIADNSNQRVRKVDPTGLITTVAGTGTFGLSGDNGPGTSAQLNNPFGLAVDASGNLYIADTFNNRIRKLTAAGVISTVAGGSTAGGGGDGGPATSAQLNFPTAVAVDAAGNLYIADSFNLRIRKVTPAGIISTIAGSGTRGSEGDGGLALSANLNFPSGVAVDSAGNIYIADQLNQRIRKLTPLVASALSIVSGDGQSAVVGRALPNSLRVKVTDASGLGVPGVTVAFAVTAGTARLSSSSIVTGADGTASVDVTLGATAGGITVTATVAGLPAVSFALTATDAPSAGPPAPSIGTGGVVGAGLSSPAVQQISANAIISIFGQNFAPAGTVRLVSGADLVNGRLPTKLADVCVQIGSQLAAMFHVFPGQLNVQAPSVPTGSANVQVIVGCGTANEVRSNIQTVTVQAATPEFFYFARNANGRNPIAATNALTGAFIGAAGLIPGVSFVAAQPGDILTLYATGFGATNPSFATGELPGGIGSVTGAVSVNIGGIDVAPVDILYVGVAPFLAGVYQVNIRAPANAPDGDLPVSVKIGAFSTAPGAFVTVKR